MNKPYERKWDNATESDVSGALAAMESGGNKAAALALAQFFYERLDGGDGELDGEREIAVKAFSPLMHKYMHLVLRRIVVDGWTPGQAMGFTARPGRPKTGKEDRDIKIAAFVCLTRMKGKSKEMAVGDAANKYFPDGNGDRATEKACAKYEDAFNLFPVEALESITEALESMTEA
jgi:hypothetical protein